MEINEFLIEENITILEVMQKLDYIAVKVLFIADDNRLKASITDGDIRRWILRGGDLNAPARAVANYHPLYLKQEQEWQAQTFMKKHLIEAVPIVEENLNIISIVAWDSKIWNPANKINVPVVIMAGGTGTRLRPYTNILPKPLIPIGDLPIVEHIINRFCFFGCRNFYMIINYKGSMIKTYFNDIERDYSITYIEEDAPLGTAGGLSLLKGKLNETFILSNCDILIDEDFGKVIKLHREKKNLITMICSLKNYTIPYGVVKIGESGQIINMQEKPRFSFFTNTGCYIVEPEIIEKMDAGIAMDFPDIIDCYNQQNKRVGVYPIGEHSWFDIGQMEGLEQLQKQFIHLKGSKGIWRYTDGEFGSC